jgi:hypothetical protein
MAKRRFDLLPRGLTDAESAAYIGRSSTWFQEHLPELEAAGFPRKLPIVDLRDRAAIDRWLDEQGGLAQDFDAAWMRAAE